MDPMSQGLPVEKCQMVQKEAASYDKRTRRIHLSEWGVGLYAISLVLLSIFLFMMNKAADQLGKFITEQNTAAIKLWTNLDHYSRHGAKEADAEASLPPGLFESLVEFSRCNASILKTVHRLRIDAVLVSSSSKLDDILPHLKSKAEEKDYFKHVGVDPRTTPKTLVEEGMYQIDLFQAIRDYSQDKYSFHTNVLGAISTYLLPVLYAVLGSFLYAFRQTCHQIQANEPASSPDRTSRFLMAAIAGIALSIFSNLLPKDTLLSPLAFAFLLGYSIDILTSHLDAYVEKFTKDPSGARAVHQ
jgi:hypothetical protein